MIRVLRTLLLLALLSPVAARAAEAVGTAELSIVAPGRERSLHVRLWYPARNGGAPATIGANPLFKGTDALADAPVTSGRHPLVLLSHGSGGQADNLGWIGGALAARGFIVAAPDHPGTTSGDSRPAETVKVWQRPADLSAVIAGLAAHPAWKDVVDAGRIGAVGFSLGGHSVLALAGARVDAKAYAAYCDVDRGPISDCAWYAKGGVDLHRLDAEPFGRSFADRRVRAVVAVDPGLAQAFQSESLKEITIPVHFVNLGQRGATWIGVEASALAALTPNATLERLADGSHFSFLGECRLNGAAILRAVGESDPLCDDGGNRPRAAIHADLARLIGDALTRDLF